MLSFAALDDTVHPRYNVMIAALIDMVNYCSDAYRHEWSIEFLLHRHICSSQSTRLNLTAVDANTLPSTYFPRLYDVDDLRVLDGLHLLRRAQAFVLSSPTHHQYTSECNERWLHLLACMFLSLEVDVTTLTNDAKATALVSQQEFLDFNEMALGLYGATLASDTYGMLRLGPFVRATRTTSLIARHLNSKFKLRNCEIWLLKNKTPIFWTRKKLNPETKYNCFT